MSHFDRMDKLVSKFLIDSLQKTGTSIVLLIDYCPEHSGNQDGHGQLHIYSVTVGVRGGCRPGVPPLILGPGMVLAEICWWGQIGSGAGSGPQSVCPALCE